MKPRTLILSAALLAAACSGMQPVPVVAGDVCFRCRRLISDVRMAGEIVSNDGHALKFRTTACMAKYLKGHPQEAAAGIFVTDFASGRMVKASAASFVPTMIGEGRERELDYVAYNQQSGARGAAARENTTPIEWDKVLAAVVE